MLTIPSRQISYRKKIGMLGDKPVVALGVIGGLHVVVLSNGAKVEPIGASPHRGMAKFLASKRHPDIVFDELEKSERFDPAECPDMVAEYDRFTSRLAEVVNGYGD